MSGFVYEPISQTLSNTTSSPNLSYLFIAARKFRDKFERDPVDKPEDVEFLINEITNLGSKSGQIQEFATYLCRFEGLPIPSVVGTFGAMVAQEVTKIIIHKPTPVKGFAYYDAIKEDVESL